MNKSTDTTQQNSKTSYVMLISSMLLIGTIGIFRRYIPLSSSLLAFVRGILGALTLCVFAKARKQKIRQGIGLKKSLLLIVTGVFLALNWVLLFEAFQYTTVATATLCYYFAPTLVMLLSPLLFQERMRAKKWVCAMVTLVGMVFISGVLENGGLDMANLKGILFGLGAAVFYALVVIMNKKILDVNSYEKTIIQLFSAGIALIPYLLVTEDFHAIKINALTVVLVLIVGVFHTGIFYGLYFGSISGLKAQTVAIFSYIDPIVALLVSALFLHEGLSLAGAIGAVLIIGGAVVSEMGN